ncbi:hypothetical protein RDABS01_019652 [Bienertia sinuspersici]
MADWGNMGKDIVTKIAEHLDFYEDFETMFKICSGWRSAAKEAKFRASCNVRESHSLPWLMLPERDESSKLRRLYSVSKHMVRQISLPDDLVNNGRKRLRLLSSHGWLLVVSEGEKTLWLFSPFFSRPRIKLPEIKIMFWSRVFGNYYKWHDACLLKFVLSADPSTAGKWIVFLTCDHNRFYPTTILLFWRNGDQDWTHIKHPSATPELGPPLRVALGSVEGFLSNRCRGVTFYQGEFYGVDSHGVIVKFETSSQSNSFVEVAKLLHAPSGNADGINWLYHLVESVGKLLVVRQVLKYDVILSPDNNDKKTKYMCRTLKFEVLELDVKNGNIKQVPSLGNRSIFIGFNSNFSADVSSAHGFKPNCIYYTDDLSICLWKGPARGGRNHCLFNLSKRKFQRIFYTGPSSHLGKLTRLMWVESPK